MSADKPENLIASLSFYLDEDEMVWLSAEWTETEEGLDQFADFMFKLHSGSLLSDCLDFLKEECEKADKLDMYTNFIFKLNAMYEDITKLESVNKERPVVRPTKVKPSFGY